MFPDMPFWANVAQFAYGLALGNFLWLYPRFWRMTGKDGVK